MRRLMLRALVVCGCLAAGVATAGAQTVDDLFADQGVGQLQLFMNSKDWQTLKETFKENTYYPADLHWNGMVVRNIGIRSRGFGSRSPNKPGLRLDFNRYSAGQHFLGLKSLVLDNLTQDPAMMRERLTLAMFQKLGFPASREAYYGLFLNNEFIGLYALVESVDKDFLKRTLGEDEGYLYEYNNESQWWFGDVIGGLDAYKQLFDPKTHEKESDAALYDPIIQFLEQVNKSSDFVGGVSPYLDLERFMTYFAAETFMADRDGICGYDGANNFYFYRPLSGPAQFLVWDKDLALASTDYGIWTNTDVNVLVHRALEVPALKAAFLSGLERAAAAATAPPEEVAAPAGRAFRAMDEPAAPNGYLYREAQRLYGLIKDAVAVDNNKPFSTERFEEEYQKILDFAAGRSGYVLGEVAKERK